MLAAEVGRVATIFHQWEVAYVAQRGEKGFKVEDFALNSNIIGVCTSLSVNHSLVLT